MREFNERVLRIAEGWKLVAEAAQVFADFFRRFGLVRINEEERSFGFVAGAELLDQRSVTIGDGAIGANENEDDEFAVRGGEWVSGPAIKIERAGLRCGLRCERN